MGVQAGSGKVFNWFANMTSVAGLLTWFGISYTYIRFYAGMKAQGIDRKTLPFSSSLQPYAAWYAAIWCLVICFVRVSVAIHSQLNIDQKNPSPLHSLAAGRSSSVETGTRPTLLQITCPLWRSQYCTLVRSSGHVHKPSKRQRWTSSPGSPRSRQILMRSPRRETRWRPSGSGW